MTNRIAAWDRAIDELEAFDAMTIAGAYMGSIDTMMLAWAMTGGKTSVVEATGRVLDRLAPILP